ncbi:helix-turn-helix domain-containing protein [Mangrovihabitans endophyticus]|uniref:helix-turn-helix domain-containing protein n=1 Tax=Mangrovihabitans endophyticus TaxID=1751298 RepID=UPI00166838C9|nr:helix-turn-helix transcriptional regulator [Mangrovihabitans endophyticus]
MARPTSTARQELGEELRRLRGTARGADVAAGLGWSESKLSRIETGRTGITESDLERLLTWYGVTAPVGSRLQGLARRGRTRAWWTPYRSALPAPYDEYVALEAEAVAMCEWEAQIVPGLLQTDEYARAVIGAGAGIADAATADRRLALRMARQAVLTRDPPPRLTVVLDESVLHREVGGPGVLRRQLQHLVDASRRPGVELRILPFRAGAHAALAESFVIFDFEGHSRAAVVHSEGMTGGLFRMKPDDVRIYRDGFADLHKRTLSVEESRAAVARWSDGVGSSVTGALS